MRAQQPAAHHRRQGQRNYRRDNHGHRQRDRKFAEQPPHHPGHEQQRNKHRNQGNGQRDDGEANLRRALIGRLQWRFPVLDIAHHIFDHHDGVINHKPGRHRQRHQRQVIQPIAQQRHHPERADQRQRQGDGRDQRRPPAAQKQKDHADHQHDGQRQRRLHIGHAGADGLGPVGHDRQVNRRRHRPLQPWQRRLNARHRLDDVGAGLALNVHDHRRLPYRITGSVPTGLAIAAIIPGGGAVILQPAHHGAHIHQPHRRAVAPGDHQGFIRVRRQDLVVGAQRNRLPRPIKPAFGAVDIGRRDGDARVLHR